MVYAEIQKMLLGAAMEEMNYADACGIGVSEALVSATPLWPDGVIAYADQSTHRY